MVEFAAASRWKVESEKERNFGAFYDWRLDLYVYEMMIPLHKAQKDEGKKVALGSNVTHYV